MEACDHYLDNIANLQGGDGSVTLPLDAQRMYKYHTHADPEMREVGEKVYLVRDELWDRALRRAAATGLRDSKLPSSSDIFAEVRDGLLREFPGKGGYAANEEFVYGFGEEDLFLGSEASTFGKWIELNLAEYRKDLDSAIEELDELRGTVIGLVDKLEANVGKKDFGACLAVTEKFHREFTDKVSQLRSLWLDEGNISPSKVCRMEEEVAKECKRISKYQDEHKREVQRVIDECAARQKKYEAAQRMRKIMAFLAFLLGGSALVLFAVRCYHDRKNKDRVANISRAIAQNDYASAKWWYDSLTSVNWLGVGRTDYLCPDFAKRLELAAENHKVHESAKGLNSKLEKLQEWLNGVDESSTEIAEARSRCNKAIGSYKALPQPMSFKELLQRDIDINSRISAAKKCESMLRSSIDTIEKIQSGWNEHLRKEGFNREIREAERQLREIDSKLVQLDLSAVSNSIVKIQCRVGRLRELAGADEVDAGKSEAFKKSADTLFAKLDDRYAKLRKEAFENLLAGVRSAIASNSVSQAWNKYVAACAFSPSDGKWREKLTGIHEEVLGLTVRAYERALSEVEKTADKLRSERTISREMLDGTRKSLKLIAAVRDGLRTRMPETRDDFKRIESRAKNVQAKLPVIVQIDGFRRGARPVDIRSAGNDVATVLNGISQETRAQCIYLLVMQDELPSGSSRLVRISDANGNTYGMSIWMSNLVPGINRLEKVIN